MKIVTKHTEVGYTNNLNIITDALREKFGFNDNSHVMSAVAAHIWSKICIKTGDEREWGTVEICEALSAVGWRLEEMRKQLITQRINER